MNNERHLREMYIQWSDLVRVSERVGVVREWVAQSAVRTSPPIPAGTYNQSSISDILDEYRGMKTMGRCYTKTTFEARLKT
jgi:hypothetical protein